MKETKNKLEREREREEERKIINGVSCEERVCDQNILRELEENCRDREKKNWDLRRGE